MRQFVAWARAGLVSMERLVIRRRLSRFPARAGVLFGIRCAALAAALVTVLPARAHHSPGHGPSEGLRNLTTMGSDPSPHQRATLLAQASRTTSEPNLNAATVHSLLLLLDLRLHRRLYVGAQLPGGLVDEDGTSAVKVGLGNLALSATVPVGSFQTEGAASWAVGFQMSLPTRTFTFEVDPGKQWTYSPNLRYADTAGKLLWYATLMLPSEHRPAGFALDVSSAAGVGVAVLAPLHLTLGAQMDVRVYSNCKLPDGSSEYCAEGRATEMDRPVGATRGYAHLGLAVDVSSTWSLFSSVQIPFLSRRDLNWALSMGLEARF